MSVRAVQATVKTPTKAPRKWHCSTKRPQATRKKTALPVRSPTERRNAPPYRAKYGSLHDASLSPQLDGLVRAVVLNSLPPCVNADAPVQGQAPRNPSLTSAQTDKALYAYYGVSEVELDEPVPERTPSIHMPFSAASASNSSCNEGNPPECNPGKPSCNEAYPGKPALCHRGHSSSLGFFLSGQHVPVPERAGRICFQGHNFSHNSVKPSKNYCAPNDKQLGRKSKADEPGSKTAAEVEAKLDKEKEKRKMELEKERERQRRRDEIQDERLTKFLSRLRVKEQRSRLHKEKKSDVQSNRSIVRRAVHTDTPEKVPCSSSPSSSCAYDLDYLFPSPIEKFLVKEPDITSPSALKENTQTSETPSTTFTEVCTRDNIWPWSTSPTQHRLEIGFEGTDHGVVKGTPMRTPNDTTAEEEFDVDDAEIFKLFSTELTEIEGWLTDLKYAPPSTEPLAPFTSLSEVPGADRPLSEVSNTELSHDVTPDNTSCNLSLDPNDSECTMNASLIVPQPDSEYSQWVSFNGDNEPVLNNAPQSEDGSDTFLKRMQRTRLADPNEQGLPTGQQFCFEAMVDKRYNRWKRRRRKRRHHEQRRQHLVVPASDSSDENADSQDRKEVEKILDQVYTQIHGSVPETPDGYKDTPRNRRRKAKPGPSQMSTEGGEHGVIQKMAHLNPASKSTSSTEVGSRPSMVSLRQVMSQGQKGSSPENSGSDSSTEGSLAWPYMEKYKEDIMSSVRLTPSEQLDQVEWLPDLYTSYDSDDEREGNSCSDDDMLHLADTPPGGHGGGVTSSSTHVVVQQSTQALHTETTTKERGSPTDLVLEGVATDCFVERHSAGVRQQRDRERRNGPSTSTADTITADVTGLVASSKDYTRSDSKSRLDQDGRPEAGSEGSNSDVVTPKQEAPTSDFITKSAKYFRRQNSLVATLKPNSSKEKLQDSTSRTGITRKAKEVYNTRKQNINLPSLNAPDNVPVACSTPTKLRRGSISQQDRAKSRVSITPEQGSRLHTPASVPNTPTCQRRGTVPCCDNGQDAANQKDGCLSSMYRLSNKSRTNTSPRHMKKTVTKLQLGPHSNKKKIPPENASQDMSFTRSFTFSTFDLPTIHKHHNEKMEKLAKGENSEVSY